MVYQVVVHLFLLSFISDGVRGFRERSDRGKYSKHWSEKDRRFQILDDPLSFEVTGHGSFSPDKSSATLQLQLQGNKPGTAPAGRPPTPSPDQGGSFTPFQLESLDTHNGFRKTHNAPPMRLDKTMCQEAANYAARLARLGTLQHSTIRGQGENLFMRCSTRGGVSARQAVTSWYNEVCKPGYNFGISGYQRGAGHFTQVVWKASTMLGIGKAEGRRSGMQCTYVVGRYKPQGNFDTGNQDYEKNVLQGSFQRSYCNTISDNPFWDTDVEVL